jgi:RimJ/RimL family protein N-acetyltransferase
VAAGMGRPPLPQPRAADRHPAPGAHRVQLEVLASNRPAISCYLACGFRREGVRREAELYPDGWKDFIIMGSCALSTHLNGACGA